MIEFAHPRWLWGLLALPLIAFVLAWGRRRAHSELARFAGATLAESLAPGHSWRRNLLKGAMRLTAFAFVVVALAAPRIGSQLVKVEREGIDVVIALDTSLSMLAEDIAPNRLERAKQEIVDLISGLKGDRVGIVAFAGDAFALCPLTVDYDAALMFAKSIDVFTVSEPGTAIDKAIRTSLALFDPSRKRDRAVVIVTDGENQEGEPKKAAQEAADAGVRIFAIGIGNPRGELIPERGTDGQIGGYKKDRSGETVLTRLDEMTLQEIAETSGGKYLPATREGLELRVLYDAISGMEQKTIKGEFVERKKDRFPWALALALTCLLLEMLVSARARLPRGGRRRVLHSGLAALFAVLLCWALPVAAARVDDARVREGNKRFRAGDYDASVTQYRSALGDSLHPPKQYQGVLYNEANARYMQGQYPQAIELYQKSFSPDSSLTGRLLYNRGNALLKSEKTAAAIESYVEALNYMPDDEMTRHNLELALKAKQQQEQQKQDKSDDKNQQKDQNEKDDGQQQEGKPNDGQNQDEQDPDSRKGDQKDQTDPQESQPDSSEASNPEADSTATPQPRMSPEDLMKLSSEDAARILQALEEQEKKLQQERRKAAFQRLKRSGKDW